MDTIYDVVVVGNGMFGAAATRHLSARGLRVVAVGPDEPVDWKTHDGVFSSHYDQGRITRIIDSDPVWAQLAQRSIAVYPELEAQSGVSFHHRSGGLWIYPSILAALAREDVGRTFGADFDRLTDKDVAFRFPFLQVPSDAITLWERGPAGYIDPRAMVRAQLAIARKHGATVLCHTVTGYTRRSDVFEVTTDGGTRVRAAKLLIAAGAYTNHVLARPLAMQFKARTILLAEIDETEARRLQTLTSTILSLADDPVLESVYSTPPVRYPDGKLCIKIGGARHTPYLLETPQQFREWFQGAGDAEEFTALRNVLLALLPGLRVASYGTKPCVVALTSHNRPYIDRLDIDQGFVVAGGCGSGAKSSDEIGRVAASLVETGAWSYDLPAGTFAARWQ